MRDTFEGSTTPPLFVAEKVVNTNNLRNWRVVYVRCFILTLLTVSRPILDTLHILFGCWCRKYVDYTNIARHTYSTYIFAPAVWQQKQEGLPIKS